MEFQERTKIIRNEEGTVISNTSVRYTAPDGSLHNVPVVNLNAMESCNETEDLLDNITIDELYKKFETKESTIEYLQKIKLLRSSAICDDCCIDMRLRTYKTTDGKSLLSKMQESVKFEKIFFLSE